MQDSLVSQLKNYPSGLHYAAFSFLLIPAERDETRQHFICKNFHINSYHYVQPGEIEGVLATLSNLDYKHTLNT